MNSTFKTLSTLAVGSVASLAIASGASALTLVQTQTFQADPGPTEIPTTWSRVFNVDKWDNVGTLVRVEVDYAGKSSSFLTGNATTASDAFIFGDTILGSRIAYSSAVIPGLNLNLIPSGTLGSDVTLTGGTPGPTVTTPTITGSATNSRVITTGLSAFEGLGTFAVNLNALASSTISSGGGNFTSTQTTTSYGDLVIRYYIQDAPPVGTPEPGTLLGLGLVGLAGVASRRLKK